MAPQGTTEEISDVGNGPAIVDKRSGVTTDEGLKIGNWNSQNYGRIGRNGIH